MKKGLVWLQKRLKGEKGTYEAQRKGNWPLNLLFFFAWQMFKSTKGLREPLSGPEFMDDPLVERL